MFRIGFSAEIHKADTDNDSSIINYGERSSAPVKSVVQVFFPDRGMTLAYYNDAFDLRQGDVVYVDGKLEGLRGRVVEVSYSFKIKLSDYHRVIALADTDVSGEFYMAGSHFVTFDRAALPYEKAVTWFKAPDKAEDEYASGSDGSSFKLNDLSTMNASQQIAERGHGYYIENKAAYISLDGTRGRAIVLGTHPYELEFEYCGGEVSGLVCNCFCGGVCKHEVAAMLQLRDILEGIDKYYAPPYTKSGYFAAMCKGLLFSLAIDGKESGSFTM